MICTNSSLEGSKATIVLKEMPYILLVLFSLFFFIIYILIILNLIFNIQLLYYIFNSIVNKREENFRWAKNKIQNFYVLLFFNNLNIWNPFYISISLSLTYELFIITLFESKRSIYFISFRFLFFFVLVRSQ